MIKVVAILSAMLAAPACAVYQVISPEGQTIDFRACVFGCVLEPDKAVAVKGGGLGYNVTPTGRRVLGAHYENSKIAPVRPGANVLIIDELDADSPLNQILTNPRRKESE